MDAFYALADQRRRKILELLAQNGQMSAGDIYKKFDVTGQAVSQHLGILLGAKLVIMQKKSQQHIYQINPNQMMEVGEWLKKMEVQWTERLDNLDKFLKAEKKNAKKR